MKNVVVLLFVVMLTTSSFSMGKEPKEKLKIISVKSHSVYFKVDPSFVGGVVEVYDANKMLLAAEELPRTYTMVFFDEKPSGKYFIKVTKGNKTIEFGYVNI
ncbi:MAG TPA: hypothetical protein VL728_15570 [Cyclobacteriaceae bacterium]|jgi:hypothetical protein|nr:hypothetical protein [Cyclobacteriaceae bacterium]